MKITIIGTGNVGSALGTGWAGKGHQVMFGSRYPDSEKVQGILNAVKHGATAGTIADAVAFGDVIAVTTPWVGAEDVANEGDWTGKVVIDTMNRFGAPADTLGSVAQDFASMIPGAKVVKAFNTIGANLMVDPQFDEGKPTMLICGDDADAKATVTELTEQMGFEVVDMGDLSQAAHVEALAHVWIALARGGMGRNHAFRLMRK